MNDAIACVAADWGTTNLRAWAMGSDGAVLGVRSSPSGLLSVKDRRFAEALGEVCAGWLGGSHHMPVILSGMIGSKLGWKEAPYLETPMMFEALAGKLCAVEAPFSDAVRIVPGVRMEDAVQPEVMRGEETQIFGALQLMKLQNGVFVLPGTHSKWAIVEEGRLVAFRTYMTGEVFGLLRGTGTLSQLMEGDGHDAERFGLGVTRGASVDAGGLLHRLFSIRTLGLFERMPRSGLASYLSGLLIGAEVRDALAWVRMADKAGITAGIGAPTMLESYRAAVKILSGAELSVVDGAAVVPPALMSIARSAGLLAA